MTSQRHHGDNKIWKFDATNTKTWRHPRKNFWKEVRRQTLPLTSLPRLVEYHARSTAEEVPETFFKSIEYATSMKEIMEGRVAGNLIQKHHKKISKKTTDMILMIITFNAFNGFEQLSNFDVNW